MQKKAAFVASVYRHFQAFHLPFVELLQRNGYEVHAYANDDDTRHEVEAAGVICHDVPISRSPFSRQNWRALRVLTASFRVEQFDLVHMHTPVAGLLGRIAANRAGVGTVLYTAHGFHFFTGAPKLNWLLYYPLERVMARLTDHLVTINEEDFARAQRFAVRKQVHFVQGVGLPVRDFHVEHATEVRRQIRDQLGIASEDVVIVCIAEMNANKNQIQLLRALRLLKDRRCGISYKCLLVGRGEMQEQVREWVNAFELEADVQLLGHRSDIAELLAASDVCTLLSWREGLPRSLMEAMAAGKPIVATRVRGNRNVVRDGENGLLVTPGNVEETADAFETLALSSERRLEMGQVGQQMAPAFDLSVIVRKMERIYLEKKGECHEWDVDDLGWESSSRRDDPQSTGARV